MLEVKPFSRGVLEAADEPLVADIILLTLPALMEQGDPDHDNYAVEDAQRRGEELAPWSILINRFYDHGYTETDASDGDWDEPACVMDKPGKIEAELRPVIVSNKVERLHVVQKALEEHTVRQSPTVVQPRLVHQFSLRHVNREVVADDPTLEQVLDVNFLLQRFDNDFLMLRTCELVKHVCREALEPCIAVVLR